MEEIKVLFGSYMYNTTTQKSDKDYYIISDSFVGYDSFKNEEGDDIHTVSLDYFENMLSKHDIAAMELFFYYDKLQEIFVFNLNLQQLRKSISAVVSNSWVKAKKKMIVEDNQEYIGRKSMWHSLRILMFGIQIAKFGKIVDYEEANCYYNDIIISGKSYEQLKMFYHPIMLEKQTEFRKYAPKE